jgi:transcription elongation factor GreB
MPASPYITPDGYQQLKSEYDNIWRVRRPEVVRALSAAAAEGDRSENAEYIYRKKELRELDRRLRYLQKRLPALKVIQQTPADTTRVFFGAWVELEDESGALHRYRIVGADEAHAANGLISVDSPLARQLLKKQEGETVGLDLKTGARRYAILSVRYV